MASSPLPEGVDPRTPVIVGVGQVLNRTDKGADPLEPVELMIEAARVAEDDTTTSGILKTVDVVAAVPTITWRYRDPAMLVAAAHGADGARTWYPTVGGNTPQMLVNRIASHIAAGEMDTALLVGAESGRAKSEAKKAGIKIVWTMQDDTITPDWTDNSPLLFSDEADLARNLIMPLQMYPVFENAIWHQSGRGLDDHMAHVAKIWSAFSKVAAANPYAWRRREYTPDELLEVTADNRMVAFPYRKLMVANPRVDMASSAILCSAQRASALGVPTDRWVFIYSGTDAKDRSVSRRWVFHRSGAMEHAGNRALELAGVGIDDVAHLDLYSCYPSAVQLAMAALGVGPERTMTVYGGLPFAGGPWNNPVGHAIASMVGVLRSDPGSRGLITANGGNVDKHAFGVYSTEPPANGFRYDNPQDLVDGEPARDSVVDHDGPATIESWSASYDRDPDPTKAHIAALTPDGARTWALTSDPEVMALLTSEDVTGRPVEIDGRGKFVLA